MTKAELQQKFPGREFARVKTQGKVYIVCSPSRTDWHRFQKAISDPRGDKVAMENLAVSCAVEPDGTTLSAIFEKKPALAGVLTETIGKLAGLDDKAEVEDFDGG